MIVNLILIKIRKDEVMKTKLLKTISVIALSLLVSGAAIGRESSRECKHHKHRHHHKHKHHSKREYNHYYYNEPAPVFYTSISRPVYAPVVERVYTQPIYVQRPYTTTVYRNVYQPREFVYSYKWGY